MKKLDTALLKLEVPDKSFHVSKAPPTERFTDEWTNVKLSKPKPGDLFNRRECSWYLSAKHKDAVLWLGLICFAREEYDKAEVVWNRLRLLDETYYASLVTSGQEKTSTHSRLIWNLQNQKGCLYATQKEMKVFQEKKERLSVCLADIALENENYSEAEKNLENQCEDRIFYLINIKWPIAVLDWESQC